MVSNVQFCLISFLILQFLNYYVTCSFSENSHVHTSVCHSVQVKNLLFKTISSQKLLPKYISLKSCNKDIYKRRQFKMLNLNVNPFFTAIKVFYCFLVSQLCKMYANGFLIIQKFWNIFKLIF